MSKKKIQKKTDKPLFLQGKVNFKKLKSFGITKDPEDEEIEEIDGDEISGGKDTSPTTAVCQQWPTTGGNNY